MARTVRREPLTRERVLRTALEIIDESGLEGLTMRGLGERLGVEAMSIYHYVAGRDAVLDGVYETVLTEAGTSGRGATPRASLRSMAQGLRAAFRRHPRAIPVFVQRPAVTPTSLGTVEAALNAFGREGMSTPESLGALQIVVAYVLGHAAMTLVHQAPSATVDYAALDATRFPRLRDAGRAVQARDVEAEFSRGLDALLDGLLRKV